MANITDNDTYPRELVKALHDLAWYRYGLDNHDSEDFLLLERLGEHLVSGVPIDLAWAQTMMPRVMAATCPAAKHPLGYDGELTNGHQSLRATRQKAIKLMAENDFPLLKESLKPFNSTAETLEALFGTLLPNEEIHSRVSVLTQELRNVGSDSSVAKADTLESDLSAHIDVLDIARLDLHRYRDKDDDACIDMRYDTGSKIITIGSQAIGGFYHPITVGLGPEAVTVPYDSNIQYVHQSRQSINHGDKDTPNHMLSKKRTRDTQQLSRFACGVLDYVRSDMSAICPKALDNAIGRVSDWLRQHEPELHRQHLRQPGIYSVEKLAQTQIDQRLSIDEGWEVLPGHAQGAGYFVRFEPAPALAQERAGVLTVIDYPSIDALAIGLAGTLNHLAEESVRVSQYTQAVQQRLGMDLPGLNDQVCGQAASASIKSALEKSSGELPISNMTGPGF